MANTYFTSKLPANHEILSKPQAVLLKRLRASALLTPKHVVVGNVQAFREQCAALVWLESDVYSLAAVKQLPPTSRIVLCTMLGIPTTPVAVQAQAGRICQHVTSKSAAPIADGAAPPPYVWAHRCAQRRCCRCSRGAGQTWRSAPHPPRIYLFLLNRPGRGRVDRRARTAARTAARGTSTAICRRW